MVIPPLYHEHAAVQAGKISVFKLPLRNNLSRQPLFQKLVEGPDVVADGSPGLLGVITALAGKGEGAGEPALRERIADGVFGEERGDVQRLEVHPQLEKAGELDEKFGRLRAEDDGELADDGVGRAVHLNFIAERRAVAIFERTFNGHDGGIRLEKGRKPAAPVQKILDRAKDSVEVFFGQSERNIVRKNLIDEVGTGGVFPLGNPVNLVENVHCKHEMTGAFFHMKSSCINDFLYSLYI